MAHYDIFRERLAITYPAFGYALWEPTPDEEHGPINIGDVGYTRQGKFYRLFNALLAADHPSHQGILLPEHHEPLIPNISNHIDRGKLKPDHYCSIGVTAETESENIRAAGPDDFPQTSFSSTGRRGGAVLSLPVDAQRQDTRARGDFGKWMVRHIDSWFAFARGLGLGIGQMEEIVLVTGLHITRSWANVVFLEGQVNGRASLGLKVENGRDITWHCSPGNVRGGVRSWGPEGKNPPENQCVLIRGFRVTRVFGIFPRRLRGAAGPDPLLQGDHDDDESDKGLMSIASETMYRDPLHVLLEYVTEQASECDMVLVHDDDLARIQGHFQSGALMDHLQRSKPEIRHVLYDCLSENESKREKITATVAMLSDGFRERDLSCRDILFMQRIKVYSNHVEVEFNPGTVYQYDVILPNDRRQSIARNHQIINALQTRIEGRLAARPGVYDGRKNLFTTFDLEFDSGAREYVVPVGTHPSVEGGSRLQEFRVRLKHVASILPEHFQSLDGDSRVRKALNTVVRMEPILGSSSNKHFIFTDREARPIGRGLVLWRGYFQSVQPANDRMLINVDISTRAMYTSGKLIDLALEFLGVPGRPSALAPRYGLLDRERIRLQAFVSGITVTMRYRTQDTVRRRVVKKLTRECARDLKVELADGRTMTVAEYFQTQLKIPLQFPDVICAELSTRAVIPLELCEVPPGQIVHKRLPPVQSISTLAWSKLNPHECIKGIRDGLSVLQHGQSEHIRRFGMTVKDELLELDARIIESPTLIYNSTSKQPNIQPRNGTWNLIDKHLVEPVKVPNWVVILFDSRSHSNQVLSRQVITDLVEQCKGVGIAINPLPVVVRWASALGNIGHQLRDACAECQRLSKAPPTLIVAILPDGRNDIYTTIKHFGDVLAGIATQCMRSSKCMKLLASEYSCNLNPSQYYANIVLKINLKLGGTNVVPRPQDVPFLTDPENPTMVMGADITHPPSGSLRDPSFTSLVGSVDSHGVRYVSRIEAQAFRAYIENMEAMCMDVFKQFRDATEKLPERILFYRNSVFERDFGHITNSELPRIRNACTKLGFNPKITLIVVGRDHKVVFVPTSRADADGSGNCPAGTVIDSGIVSPTHFNYYLYGHAVQLGMSRPAHYTVLLDENNFTNDSLQSLSFALCHVHASCTRSVSIPAPVFYARKLCSRAINHYDPQESLQLFTSDIETETTDPAGAGSSASDEGVFQGVFRQPHERMAGTMYFC